jgi:CRP/FNR family transcriptional regulator, cyclic AMP receptor protein
MDPTELQQVLKDHRFFPELSELAAHKLAERIVVREFPAQAVIFEEGAHNNWVYFITAGQVALEMNAPPRGRTRILTLGPGDILAWSALLGGGRMTTSAIALSDSQALAISASDIDSLCKLDDRFGYLLFRDLATALAKRLTATRLQMLDLFGSSPPA